MAFFQAPVLRQHPPPPPKRIQSFLSPGARRIGFRFGHPLQQTAAVFPVRRHFLAGKPDRQAAAAAQGSTSRPGSEGLRPPQEGSAAPASRGPRRGIRPPRRATSPKGQSPPPAGQGRGHRAAEPGPYPRRSAHPAQPERSGLPVKTGSTVRNQPNNRLGTHLNTLFFFLPGWGAWRDLGRGRVRDWWRELQGAAHCDQSPGASSVLAMLAIVARPSR